METQQVATHEVGPTFQINVLIAALAVVLVVAMVAALRR